MHNVFYRILSRKFLKGSHHIVIAHLYEQHRHKVRVAIMTHDHDDTLHAIFNTTSSTCWKVSEVIDFDPKNQSSKLPACFSALICDFSQFNKIPLSKTMKIQVLRIFANLIFMDSWKWGNWAIYIINLFWNSLSVDIPYSAKDISVVKSGTRNDFRSSWLYDTLNKLSSWHFFEHD